MVNMRDVEIIIECDEFKDFLIKEKNALEENSLTIARSKHYDSDGLKMVVDFDEDHYSIRVENFETSDIEFKHLNIADIEQAETVYDDIMLVLAQHIQPFPIDVSKNSETAVKTPLGILTINKHEDDECSGFSIYLEDEIVATVEYEKEKGLRVFTYGDMTDEEPTHIEKVINIDEQLAKA